jgi:RNA polymerase sigma factor for flagellar operon FliA
VTGITDALWTQYREGRDEDIRRALLDQYVGLVHFAAREMTRRVPPGLDVEDLVSAGTVGLVQALEGFEPSRGLAFSTFAMPRIRGAMLDELRSWDWVPRTIRDRGKKIEKARALLEKRLGRPPDLPEIATHIGIDPRTCAAWMEEARGPVFCTSDPAPVTYHDGDPRRIESIPDRGAPAPIDSLLEEESLSELRAALASLSAKERTILSLYYYEELTLKQIGNVLNITESRVSQIHSRAIHRLRERASSQEKAA